MIHVRSVGWSRAGGDRELMIMLAAIITVIVIGAAYVFRQIDITAQDDSPMAPVYQDVPTYLIPTPEVGPAPA